MIGKTVSNYRILEQLGAGGMGVVYKAEDVKLGRTVALKFLPPHLSASNDTKQRFIREAKAASTLDHTNICTIHEINETDKGELYIVMAHYDGQSLAERLESGKLAIDEAADIALQLARALEHAHDAGIVHRDLKPGNIMITEQGQVKLLDFGLAKLASATQLTQEGTTLGTIGYMSPEQVTDETMDHRTDLWSFGVVLFEMLAGRRPFVAEMEPALLYSIVHEDPPQVAELRPDVPPYLAELVMVCLQKEVDDRVASAGDICDMLSGLSSAVSRVAPKRQSPRLAWVGIAAITLVVAVAAVFVMSRQAPSPKNLDLSVDRVIVAPFAVRGSPDLGYLSEGIVDLISAKLNTAGILDAVNPRAVIARFEQLGVDSKDPTAGRQVAEQLQAGNYVIGDIVEAGGQVQLTAYLYDTQEIDKPPQQATARGEADDLFDMIDALVGDLLVDAVEASPNRMQQLATTTTASLPAVKHYLEGERLLRAGQYREAAVEYARAVEIDSSFALAYYRKSMAADWIDAPDVRETADKAFELADKLAPRERDLVTALRMRRYGRNTDAEQAYRALLHQYPTEVEALVQLGEVLFHDNPRTGRPVTESLIPFRKAIELEPGNLIAHIHNARSYAMMDSMDALSRTAAALEELAPDSPRRFEARAMHTYMTGDSVERTRLIENLSDKPWYYRWYSAHAIANFARDAAGASDLLNAGSIEALPLRILVSNLLLARGKIPEYRALTSKVREQRSPSWDLFEAFIATTGVYPVSEEALSSLANRLRLLDPAQILSTSWTPPYYDLTVRFAAFERDYYVALMLILLNRVSEARDIIEPMTSVEDFPGLGSYKQDVLTELEAEVRYQANDLEGALDLLRTIHYDIPHAVTVRPSADGSRSRFLHADLEMQIGDREVAKRYFESFEQSWSFWDTTFRQLAYDRLAQIAESEGDVDETVMWCDRLLELWRDCDDEWMLKRDEVKERRDRAMSGASNSS